MCVHVCVRERGREETGLSFLLLFSSYSSLFCSLSFPTKFGHYSAIHTHAHTHKSTLTHTHTRHSIHTHTHNTYTYNTHAHYSNAHCRTHSPPARLATLGLCRRSLGPERHCRAARAGEGRRRRRCRRPPLPHPGRGEQRLPDGRPQHSAARHPPRRKVCAWQSSIMRD